MVRLDKAAGVIEIVEESFAADSPALVAVTVARTAVVTEGAVNSPLVEIVPALALQ
jgi:hypothetical protein